MRSRILILSFPLAVLSAQQNAVLMAIPPFLDSHQYSAGIIGMLSSISPLLTLLSRVPGGLLYRRTRARQLMALALLVVASTNVLFAEADTPFSFVTISALNGFAGGVVTTLYLPFFLDALPPGQSRLRAMAWYTGVVALGFAVGGVLAGYVADHWGFGRLFAGAGFAAVVAMGLLLLRNSADAGMSSSAAAATPAVPRGPWLHRLLRPEVATVILVAVFLNVLYKLPATFLPIYAVAAGLTLTDVGLIMGAYALCNAIVRPLSGPWIERLGTHAILRFGLPVQALVLMFVPLFQHALPLLVLAIGAGVLRAIVMVANAAAMTEAMSERHFSKGVASGVFNGAADVGMMLGPLFGGLVAAVVGTSQLFLFAPALIAAVFGLALFGLRSPPSAKGVNR